MVLWLPCLAFPFETHCREGKEVDATFDDQVIRYNCHVHAVALGARFAMTCEDRLMMRWEEVSFEDLIFGFWTVRWYWVRS